ncbi:aromatic ring-hydroxylating oxygenase subunit alpha [Qingshengfaniella alkalisoli]|uniref:Aromatic ring-hydroxylating dioxygenase subunit alpha n=1 Tax=Qingshengfaniella alkalisoli TaxID=2599296 RepID=A0A5B8IYW8_9RHOB|nr:aromatic ring-hydroxylating dioxygenase subunit alpha [Qingshengfaniella alkalisoli]QDY70773.1 aromatic ring-hydroxylating dioxygenase subunit alpha [Qingshengfaniella alkalisoli]
MATDSDVLAALMSRRPGFSLPQPFYTDAGFYDCDLRNIWYKDWLLTIAAPEVPKTGSFVTLQIGNAPVLIVRGADGAIRAFHNSCRHRGSRICAAERGRNAKLTCPYHQWTYDLDGSLVYAREMHEDIDPADFGLKPIHCETAAGIVFICLAKDAPDFAPVKAMAEKYASPHDITNLKVAATRSIVENGNWKLVMENNRECYHCAGSHPLLCRTFPDDPNLIGSFEGTSVTVGEDHVRRCEAAGMPSRFYMEPNGQWRFVRIPFIGDACSYTEDGTPAVTKRVGQVPFDNAGSLLFFHYPNTWNHMLSDSVTLFRMTPISPTATQVYTTWLVHADAEEGVDYDVDRLTRVWIQTNLEDQAVVEENQRGILSPAYEPGPYSSLQETGVIQFIDWYAATLQQRLTGRSNTMAAE